MKKDDHDDYYSEHEDYYFDYFNTYLLLSRIVFPKSEEINSLKFFFFTSHMEEEATPFFLLLFPKSKMNKHLQFFFSND